MCPKVFSAAILLSLVSLDCAIAERPCGPGFHRNAYGRCTPNGSVVDAPSAPIVVEPGAPVVVAPPAVACPSGFRWHSRFRRCVVV